MHFVKIASLRRMKMVRRPRKNLFTDFIKAIDFFAPQVHVTARYDDDRGTSCIRAWAAAQIAIGISDKLSGGLFAWKSHRSVGKAL